MRNKFGGFMRNKFGGFMRNKFGGFMRNKLRIILFLIYKMDTNNYIILLYYTILYNIYIVNLYCVYTYALINQTHLLEYPNLLKLLP
jgi:hypothetical protein